LIGWFIALIGGVGGLFFSFWWDLPSGAAIVCTFGALLILVSAISLLRRKPAA
jgi:ABC-type Mn2+/Zn2+ transport system permease subunit